MIKVTYIPGPGDVVGTYQYWKDGIEDPRVPVVTYSSMLYTSIRKLGAELQVITTFPKPENAESWITFSQIPKTSNTKNYFHAQIERVYSIRKQLDLYKPDLVIVGSDIPVILLFILKNKRWKLCLSIHNTYWPAGRKPDRNIKSRIKYFITKTNIQLTDGALCTSAECENQYKAMMSKTVPVYTEIPIVRHEYSPNKSICVSNIAFIGRIESNKGIFMLAEIVNELNKSYPELTCYFAGAGSDQKKLEDYISQSNHKSLKYLGRLSADEVHELLESVDLLVVPTLSSFNEGLALVGFEAAAHLVPCLYSDVVPAKDSFKGACSVFEADNKEDCKRKLIELLENDEFYLSLRQKLSHYSREMQSPDKSWGEHLIRMVNTLLH